MRKIAVISDTHDRLPATVVAELRSADEVWHLGDVCAPATLEDLSALGLPLYVVCGNCDNPLHWPVRRRLERHGRTFQLEHIPPERPLPEVHVVLHGHTHVPRDEIVRGVRFLNPGCITHANRGAPASFAWLTITPDGALSWEIVPVAPL